MQFCAILYTLLNLQGESAIVKCTSLSMSLPRVGVNIHCFSLASQNKNIVACLENKNQVRFKIDFIDGWSTYKGCRCADSCGGDTRTGGCCAGGNTRKNVYT